MCDELIDDLFSRLAARDKEVERLREAFVHILDCNFVIPLPDRMGLVSDIARQALTTTAENKGDDDGHTC